MSNRLLKRLEKEQLISCNDISERQIQFVVDQTKLTGEGFPKYLELATLSIVMETTEEHMENKEDASVKKETLIMEGFIMTASNTNIFLNKQDIGKYDLYNNGLVK